MAEPALDRDVDRFRRYTRWYPREWRALHEEALISDLIALTEAAGRTIPPRSERIALISGGLAARLRILGRILGRVERPRPAALALIAILGIILSPLTLVQPSTAATQDGYDPAPAECDPDGLPIFRFDDAPQLRSPAGTAEREAEVQRLAAYWRDAEWADQAAACGYRISQLTVSIDTDGNGARTVSVSFGFGFDQLPRMDPVP